MNNIVRILTVLSILVFAYSCDIVNPVEQLPAYIQIDEIDFSTEAEQGVASSNISDAWVFINDVPVGGHKLPAIIPVLAEGNTRIIVAGGIRQNGFSTVPIRYPLWSTFNREITLVPTETLKISPVVTYRTDLEILIEDFETGTDFSSTAISVPYILETDPEIVFSGARSLSVTLDSEDNFFEIQSPLYDLDNPQDVYLEFDYRCNQPFDVWFKAVANGSFIESYQVTLSAKEEWNHIYISLAAAVSQVTDPTSAFSTNYQYEFKGLKSDDVDIAKIYFDNVKLTYY